MKKVLSLIFFSFSLLTSMGQAKFYAQLNTKSVPLNQNFQLSYSIENAEGQNLRLPNLNDFQVLSGPHTSQNMQWVNGVMSQSVTYSYILKPKKEGNFKIGKASVQISGATLESNELNIQVTSPAQQNNQQAQRRSQNPFGWDPFEDPFGGDPFDPFGQGQQQEEPAVQSTGDVDKQIRDNVFLRMVTSKNKVYVGEHLTASLKLYYRLNFGNTQMVKAPKFDGFWSQEVAGDPNQKPKVETVNGQEFYVLEIQRYDLYPQRAGNLQISATELNMVVQAQIQSKRRSVWDIFNGAQLKNLQYKPTSNAIAIQVEELPSAGKPENFSGAVGQFKMEAKLSSQNGKTDEPITLSLKVNGTGNLKTMEMPKPNLPDGFEAFDPKMKESIAGISGTKEADYLLIPRQPGEYKIPAVDFAYFDPTQEKYFSLKSPEFPVSITGEPSKLSSSNTLEAQKQDHIQVLGKDIRYIKTDLASLESNQKFIGSPLHVGLMISPFLLFIGAFAYKKKQEADSADVVGGKIKKATKMARKRLESANKHLKNKDAKAFYDEVSRAILGYFSDKLQIPVAELSKENIEARLADKSVIESDRIEIKKLLEFCDIALYTNQTSDDNMQQRYEEAIALISKLDNQLSK